MIFESWYLFSYYNYDNYLEIHFLSFTYLLGATICDPLWTFYGENSFYFIIITCEFLFESWPFVFLDGVFDLY